MLAISNRYGFNAALRILSWNNGWCVNGVQLATTTRFNPCSFTRCVINLIESCEQAYNLSSAWTTCGSVRAYSVTAGTSRNPAMFDPQWHTNTPMRGSSFVTSRSVMYSRVRVRDQRASVNKPALAAAAPLASTTDSGMSFGSRNGPTA